MKPFDLEKALAGEPVVTRNGREVTQLQWFETEIGESLAGVVGGRLKIWNRNGCYYSNHEESDNDLFMKSKTVVKWVNIYLEHEADYGDIIAFHYTTEEEANRAASKSWRRLGNKAHRIEWEE